MCVQSDVERKYITFRKHYDDSVRDSVTGAKSEWTLLVYLTGIEDGIEGGEVNNPAFWPLQRLSSDSLQTLFYKEQKGKATEVITPPLTRGTALLHRYDYTTVRR
jgi:hypothetical protein